MGEALLGFAELPEESAFRRSYTLYDPTELEGLLDPGLAPHVRAVVDGHRELVRGQPAGRPRQPDVPDRHPAVPPGLNLAYTDRSSMAASTEVRVPFVDPHVFRAAFSFSGSRKIKGRTQKIPLRDVAGGMGPP